MQKDTHVHGRDAVIAGIGEHNRYLIDGDNGDVIAALHKGDRIIRKDIMDMLSSDDTRIPFSNGQFEKAYSEALAKLAKLNLFQSEYRIVLLFLTLIKPSSGLIAYGNFKPVRPDYIARELNLSEKTVTRSIKRLLDLRVISKSVSGTDTLYFFNPYICQKGRYINKTLYEMFKKSEWAKENHHAEKSD